MSEYQAQRRSKPNTPRKNKEQPSQRSNHNGHSNQMNGYKHIPPPSENITDDFDFETPELLDLKPIYALGTETLFPDKEDEEERESQER